MEMLPGELATTCENWWSGTIILLHTCSRGVFIIKSGPINTPEDAEGLENQAMGSELMIETMKALGASPTTTAYSEAYSALQTE